MSTIEFDLPAGDSVVLSVTSLFNAGFAGRDAIATRAHIEELARIGVTAPASIPAVYSLPPYLATQHSEVIVRSDKTSGEVEAALVVVGPGAEDILLTVASDHSDRELEAYDIAAGKAAAPDVFAKQAWRLSDVAERLNQLKLNAWAGDGQTTTAIQRGSVGDVLEIEYWLELLHEQELYRAGTVLLLGTIPMVQGVDQFQDHWHLELEDPVAARTIACSYDVRLVPNLSTCTF